MSEGHHIVPVSIYAGVLGVLMVFTVITVLVSQVDFGLMNLPIALLIATIKASFVVLFFMHVKYGTKLTKLFVVSSFFFMAILFYFTFFDYLTRHWD